MGDDLLPPETSAPEDISLSEENKAKIIEFWNSRRMNPPKLKEIIELIFGKEFDGRSKQGKVIKDFLAERNIKVLSSNEYQKQTDLFVLTEDQKMFLSNNASTMSVMELANSLFPEKKLTPLHLEVRAIREHLKSLPPNMLYNEGKGILDEAKYRPPCTMEQVLFRVNKYIAPGIDPKKMTHKQKQDLTALMGYLSQYRLRHIMDNFEDDGDRELFESSFIGYTFDKSDVTAEEIDCYINLALDIVNLSNTQKQINRLTKLLETCADDSEGKKISMSLAETIHNAQTEYHQNKMRQQKMIQDLQGKRSDRISSQLKTNASILNLVNMWKEEEERKQLIKYAQLQQEAVGEEINRLTSIDDLKCRMFGISREEILLSKDEK